MNNKDRGFRIVAVMSLLIAVIGLSVAYASYSANLDVEGTATVDSATWIIKWTGLDAGTATGTATTEGSTLAIDSSNQSISGSLGTIKNIGDTLTYTWNVKNEGKLNAVLAGVTKGALTCTSSNTADFSDAAAAELCSKLSLSITYGGVELPDNGVLTSLNTSLNSAATVPMTMTLAFNDFDPSTTTYLQNGVGANVTVTVGSTTLTYNQKIN